MTLQEARRRRRNACKRALYWSGNPSFACRRYRPSATRRNASLQYELAMADCASLALIIVELGGRRPSTYDPRAAWSAAFNRMQNARKVGK